MALHAKANAEAGYRFYALYDKIYREDLCTPYASTSAKSCRSTPGAPLFERHWAYACASTSRNGSSVSD
ncbi:hypothetical protein OKW35_002334 [Paraburkholderia sp. MM5477-R1]